MSKNIQPVKKTVNFNIKLYIQSQSRQQIFRDQPSLAWDMMQQQCNIYTNPQLQVQQVNKLSALYCKIVERLNSLQDHREKYFMNKMQRLMSEPFIIRTYSNHAENKQKIANELDCKRKQLQLKLSIQTEKQNSQTFQYILNVQNEKQKKLQSKISSLLSQHQKKLQDRLQLRQMKSSISPKKKNSMNSNDSIIQLKNPENKNQQIYKLNLSGSKSNRMTLDYAAKIQTERQVLYFDQSEYSSEDEYKIDKLIREEKRKKQTNKKNNY